MIPQEITSALLLFASNAWDQPKMHVWGTKIPLTIFFVLFFFLAFRAPSPSSPSPVLLAATLKPRTDYKLSLPRHTPEIHVSRMST